MHSKTTTTPAARSRLLPTAAALSLLAGVPFAATNAQASCADPRGPKGTTPHQMPFLQPSDNGGGDSHSGDSHSIVGLWHVSYTIGGDLFYEAFDEWHADGTELESANASPIDGNVCVGAWKQTSDGRVKLFHIGWTFDDSGNSAGTFTINESNRVNAQGSAYSGMFEFKVYDTDGNLVADLTGNVAATRITPNGD
ncbi:MAG TPA: hypothetical protein VMT09_08760 [Steroidobacteraceae bacterium]|nr:hypothetical protein [Steroidobacteraceae bacterium]